MQSTKRRKLSHAAAAQPSKSKGPVPAQKQRPQQIVAKDDSSEQDDESDIPSDVEGAEEEDSEDEEEDEDEDEEEQEDGGDDDGEEENGQDGDETEEAEEQLPETFKELVSSNLSTHVCHFTPPLTWRALVGYRRLLVRSMRCSRLQETHTHPSQIDPLGPTEP